MAPSPPPPPSKVVLAAFTIASMASLVMSPRTRASLGSAMLRFVNQANPTSVFVERPRCFQQPRCAIQGKRLRFRMGVTPFGEGAAHSAFAGNIKLRREFADVVKDQQAARRERGIPEIEFGERGPVFVGAVENDELGTV